MINGFEDAQKFGREGMTRAVESLGALSRGWQAWANETAGYSKQSFEDGAAHVEKLLAARSLDVAVTTQSEFVKTTYEKAIGQATRFAELYLDAVKDVMKPFDGFLPPVVR
jgi:phasin family protein